MSPNNYCPRALLAAGLVALVWSLAACEKAPDQPTAPGSKTQEAATSSGEPTSPSEKQALAPPKDAVLVEIDGVAYIDEELNGFFDFPAYVGFTAGTGGDTNHHLIDSLTFTELSCEE